MAKAYFRNSRQDIGPKIDQEKQNLLMSGGPILESKYMPSIAHPHPLHGASV